MTSNQLGERGGEGARGGEREGGRERERERESFSYKCFTFKTDITSSILFCLV